MRALDKLSNNLNKLVKVNQVLVKSINKLETRLSKVTSKGFDDLGKGATTASQNISKTTASLTKFQKIQGNVIRTGLGVGGSIAGGVFGSGMVIQRSIDDINKLGNVFGITLIKAKGLEVAVSALKGALATGGGVGIGVALAGVIAALGKGAKDSYKLGQNLRDLTNKAGLTFKPINQDLDFTVKKFEKLNVQATNFVNLLRVMNPGSKGNVLRNTLRSQAGRAGTGFGGFSSAASQITPMMSRGAGYGRGSGLDVSEQAMFGISTRYSTGRIGPMHPSEYYAKQASPLLGKYDAATSKSIARHTKHLAKISKATSKTASILTKQTAMDSLMPTGYLPGGIGQYSQAIGPQLPLANRLGFGKNANPQGIFASRQGRSGRVRGAISSGLIGGGFPALFGQSPLASLFGGVGGLAGGALGGGFGFGLSIAGTAIASRIQETIDFRKSIKDLNVEMKAMGFNSGFNAKEIIKLGKSLGITKQEAVQVAEEFKRFGKQGALFAQAFGGDYGAFTAVAQATEVESAMAAIKAINKDLSLEEELRYTLALRTLGVEKTIDQLLKTQLEKQRQKVKEGFAVSDPDGQKLRPGLKRRQTQTLNEEDERIQETIDGLQRIRDAYKEVQLAAEANSRSIVVGLENVNRELRKLNDPQFQIVEGAKAISEAFSTSFKGIISGTMSVQQAFANMFQRIADHFLDMAAQMAATQLQKGILSMFANSFTAGLGSSALSGATFPTDVGGSLTTKQAFSGAVKLASGGYVTRPTVGLVGEAGEDEYVIPASKMASSMQRYSAGARGDAVVTGGGSSYAGGGAGGSTTVNYSGPILNFNSEEFVPKSAVGQIIATATSRGAKAGEARTLSSLQNSRSRRSNLGL